MYAYQIRKAGLIDLWRRFEEFIGVLDVNQTPFVRLMTVFWSILIVEIPCIFTYRMAGELQTSYREIACSSRPDKCACLQETVRGQPSALPRSF
jgi:hypothetical protein